MQNGFFSVHIGNLSETDMEGAGHEGIVKVIKKG